MAIEEETIFHWPAKCNVKGRTDVTEMQQEVWHYNKRSRMWLAFLRVLLLRGVPWHPHLRDGPDEQRPLRDVPHRPVPHARGVRAAHLWQRWRHLPERLPPAQGHLLPGPLHRGPTLRALLRWALCACVCAFLCVWGGYLCVCACVCLYVYVYVCGGRYVCVSVCMCVGGRAVFMYVCACAAGSLSPEFKQEADSVQLYFICIALFTDDCHKEVLQSSRRANSGPETPK